MKTVRLRHVFLMLSAYLVFCFCTCGCTTLRPVRVVPLRTETKIVERIVSVELPADSSTLRALLECDSLNNVIVKELTETKTGGMSSGFSFENTGKRTVMEYVAVNVRDTVYVKATDSVVYEEVPFFLEVPVETNRLTDFQIFQIWMFWIFVSVIFIYVISLIFIHKK